LRLFFYKFVIVIVCRDRFSITTTTNDHDYKLDTLMSHIDLTQLLAVAQETTVAAGDLIRQKWDQPRQTCSKGFRALVTNADLAAQRLITDRIQRAFPSHGFLREEENAALPTEGTVIWVIDPVDGTTNYSRQLPVFCVSIAAAVPGAGLVVGVVYDPMRQEYFSGVAGAGLGLASLAAATRTALRLPIWSRGGTAGAARRTEYGVEPGPARRANLGLVGR
jgi:fructose-1,6-bisphosphatase/inositol monophosphatase family enzyme